MFINLFYLILQISNRMGAETICYYVAQCFRQNNLDFSFIPSDFFVKFRKIQKFPEFLRFKKDREIFPSVEKRQLRPLPYCAYAHPFHIDMIMLDLVFEWTNNVKRTFSALQQKKNNKQKVHSFVIYSRLILYIHF